MCLSGFGYWYMIYVWILLYIQNRENLQLKLLLLCFRSSIIRHVPSLTAPMMTPDIAHMSDYKFSKYYSKFCVP